MYMPAGYLGVQEGCVHIYIHTHTYKCGIILHVYGILTYIHTYTSLIAHTYNICRHTHTHTHIYIHIKYKHTCAVVHVCILISNISTLFGGIFPGRPACPYPTVTQTKRIYQNCHTNNKNLSKLSFIQHEFIKTVTQTT